MNSKNGFVKADVITCAAPNTSAYLRYYDPEMKDFQKIYEVIKSRIEFIISTVSCFGIDTLILGVYGCGVFGNDPSLIASMFIDSLIQHIMLILEKLFLQYLHQRHLQFTIITIKHFQKYCLKKKRR